MPEVEKIYAEADKGALFRVSPAPGKEVEAGTTVKMFVSLGFPALAYDNEKDVLLVNGSDGSTLEAIADGLAERARPHVQHRRRRRRVHVRPPGLRPGPHEAGRLAAAR